MSMPWSLLSLIFYSASVLSQSISTNTPLPPLQWINITGSLGGSNGAPPLKDASIGYDETSRMLIIFGGESQGGFPQGQTYLLNLNTLQWQQANSPTGLTGGPPARSAAISSDDFAASSRHAHIVIGGKGASGEPLDDVWEFDYISQFWSQVTLSPGGPSARYGAAGGGDIRSPFLQDSTSPTPNNSFYLAGGFDGHNENALSDLWRLNVSGTLSSNNANSATGSWEKITLGNSLPARSGLGSAVVYQSPQTRVVAVGGCSGSPSTNSSCADGGSYSINVDTQTAISPSSCPAPRLGPALAYNALTGSSSFTSQIFVLLGTFNSSMWNDGGGLEKGEVAILDADTGTWTRVLPSGDPGSGGSPTFPSPREGAVALSYSQALVGTNRAVGSDTIVFGGQDASGNYLSEIWILRAYNGTLTQSNQKWSGFGNGQLQSGVNADGEGVTIQYLTSCASQIGSPTSSSGSSSSRSTSTPNPASSGQAPGSSGSPAAMLYETSLIHKVLAPVAIAVLLPAITLFRFSSSPPPSNPSGHRMGIYYLAVVLAIAAYGIGIGGVATSFTSISQAGSFMKRSSSSLILKTNHGKAGVALFALMCGLVPLLFLLSWFLRFWSSEKGNTRVGNHSRVNSGETAEKLGLYANRVGSPLQPPSEVGGATSEDASPLSVRRQRTRSWHALSPWPASHLPSGRKSSESALASAASVESPRSFEVTNRRARHPSSHSLGAFVEPRATPHRKNLSDMSWLERRRSLNTIGDLDYALNQLPRRNQEASTPGTAQLDMASTRGLVGPLDFYHPELPSPLDSLIHILLHLLILGLCALSLVALWQRAPKAAFAVFLAWTILFYIFVFIFAWHGVPRVSILSVIFSRLRTKPHAPRIVASTPSPSRPLSSLGLDSVPFPSDSRGPYQHHPPFRATGQEDGYLSSSGHGVENDDGDGEDELTRQWRIEEEMNRRDVSIVTVPKRRLFLTNPEIPRES